MKEFLDLLIEGNDTSSTFFFFANLWYDSK